MHAGADRLDAGASRVGFRPRLREDIEVAALSEGTPRELHDPVTGHRVRLAHAWEKRAVDLLDGTRSIPSLHAELTAAARASANASPSGSAAPSAGAAALGGLAPPSSQAVGYLAKRLRYLRMLDCADRAYLERVRAARAEPWAHAQRVAWRVPRGLRFACQGSGGCCRSYQLGPISAACAATLEALPGLAERFPELAGRPAVARVAVGREAQAYLHGREDGSCIYLQPGERCGIHAHYGPDAKPLMCRAFPHGARLTLDAKEVYDRAQCHAYGKSAFEGDLLADRAAARDPVLWQMIATGGLYHPQVSLDGYLELDFGLFAPFRRHLVEVVEVVEAPWAAPMAQLGAVREATHALFLALGTADDARASPEEIVGAVAGRPASERYVAAAPAPDPRRGLEALAGYLHATCEGARRSLLGPQLRAVGHTPPERLAPMLAGLRAASLLCSAEAFGAGAEALAEGDDDARAAAAVAGVELDVREPALARRLAWVVRDLIVTHDDLTRVSWTVSFAGLVGVVVGALAIARCLAWQEGRAAADARDVDRAQVLAIRAVRFARAPGVGGPTEALCRALLVDLAWPRALCGEAPGAAE